MRTHASKLVLLVLGAVCGCGRTGLFVAEVAADATPLDDVLSPTDAPDAPDTTPIDVGVDAPTTSCPIDPPLTTAACANVGAVCSYRGACSGEKGDRTVFRCERDGWLEVARCIDQRTCPSTPPSDGTPCAEHGLDCFYSNASCATSAIAQCATSVWQSVNDCGARASSSSTCVLTPTLTSDRGVLLEAKGTIASRATLAAAGTQLRVAYALTPMFGGSESLDTRMVQSAIPSMAAPLAFSPFGPYRADTMPALDFSGDRFALSWGSGEFAGPGASVAVSVLDGPAPLPVHVLDHRSVDQVDVATRTVAGKSLGWIVHRHPLGDFTSVNATSAVAIADDGSARGVEQPLADERDGGPGVGRLHHVWAAIARTRDGFVIVSSVGPAGDLFDDTGLRVWFVDDPTATTLPTPVRYVVGQTVAGDIVGLDDGTVVVAYAPEKGSPRTPYVLRSLKRDGSSIELTPPDLGVASAPSPPELVPFEGGFALVFSAVRATLPDTTPGFLTIALRTPTGEAIVSPIIDDATGLFDHASLGVAVSTVDRALHVAWTQSSAGSVRVMRQRFVCRGVASSLGG